jgi:methanogen homocitrate synthase
MQGRLFVSSHNFRREIVKDDHLTENIIINDVVLREEVKLDVTLSQSQKVEIAQKLYDLGVHQIQLHSEGVKELIPAIKKAGVEAEIDVLCRPLSNPEYQKTEYGYSSWQEEIDSSIESGADTIHLCVHPGRLLHARWPEEEILERLVGVVEYAKSKGAKGICSGVVDATRGNVPIGFIKRLLKEAAKHGANRIHLSDTVGIMRPAAMKWFVQEMKESVGLPVGVHCHNDFGLATANTLSSAEGGATILDVAMNSLDRARSGVASLDEVVMSLLCLYGKDIGIRTEKLWQTARYFEEISALPLPSAKPITGLTSWAKRADHALIQVVERGLPAFPFDPSLVGYKGSAINLGRGIGPIAIRQKLNEVHLNIPENRIEELVMMVTAQSVKKHRALSDEEFVDLVKKVQA